MNNKSKHRVLLVDDEDSYRLPVARYLQERGYLVDTASNADQALTLMKHAQGNYDIVFVDQMLYGHDMDGIQLVRRILDSYPKISVVVVTGWGSPQEGIEALRSGAYRYISKSAGVQELELLIELASETKKQSATKNTKMESKYLRRAQKVRILAVFANPRGSDPLRLGNEDRIIHECIKLSKHRDKLILDVLHATTIHDIRRALLDNTYFIVHFSGHGTGKGLALEDDIGNPKIIPQEALADLLATYSPPLECVVLNACYSNTQGQLTSLGVPFTIGMDGAISDEGAIEFSRGFYDAISAGKTVEFAYQEGCRTINLLGLPDGKKPILFKKDY